MHAHEDDLVLHYYGELRAPDAGKLERHLRECDACRDSFHRLEQVLRAVDAAPAPEPGEGFEREMWDRLRPGLRAVGRAEAGPRQKISGWVGGAFGWIGGAAPGGRWILAGGMAALVLIAFIAGALWRQTAPSPDDTVATDQNARPAPATGQEGAATSDLRQRLLLAAVGEHLDRTGLVLIELLNAHGRDTVDITSERTRAEELAAENRLYRQTAAAVGDQAVVSLLDELDRILTEVAGGPPALAAADLDSMRRRIERQNLLFKVQVTASDVRERERAALARRSRMTS